MPSYRFVIRKPESQDMQAICVVSRFGRNDKLMYATPLRTEAVNWDAERQRVRNSRYCLYSDDVNRALADLSATLDSAMVRSKVTVDKEFLRSVLDGYFGKAMKADTFTEFFAMFLREMDTHQGVSGVLADKTKESYDYTYGFVKEYEAAHKKLGFEDINYDFMNNFVSFLHERNMSANTVKLVLSKVRAVMNSAIMRGLTNEQRWRFYTYSAPQTDAVALDEDELERVRTCVLGKKHLSDVRDAFLMACWTGLRYSDLARLKKEDVHEDMIVVTQKKTMKTVAIPIHPVFKELWEKHGGMVHLSKVGYFNMNIREVCKEAGINDAVFKTVVKGGRKTTVKCEKWQLVTSHTARRSFATNLYKSGFPSIGIMAITGHKTETAFLRYIRVSSQEHADMLAKHWKNR